MEALQDLEIPEEDFGNALLEKGAGSAVSTFAKF